MNLLSSTYYKTTSPLYVHHMPFYFMYQNQNPLFDKCVGDTRTLSWGGEKGATCHYTKDIYIMKLTIKIQSVGGTKDCPIVVQVCSRTHPARVPGGGPSWSGGLKACTWRGLQQITKQKQSHLLRAVVSLSQRTFLSPPR